MTNKDKLILLPMMIEPMKKKLEEAVQCLNQAQSDWCILNSSDGDKSTIQKPPILNTVEGCVCVETAMKVLVEIERLLHE